MRKLFGGGARPNGDGAKKDGAGPLTNKTVQVGPHQVLVEHVLVSESCWCAGGVQSRHAHPPAAVDATGSGAVV
jgi:hypothetical protein